MGDFCIVSLLCDVGTKKVRSLAHYSFLPFFLAPHKKEAKKLSGSTYVFGVRSRSSVSLAVVSATTTKLTRPRVKTRFSSFAQTIDTMHSLRRVAYFASDSLMNPNPLRRFLYEKEVHSMNQSIVVSPADLKRFSRRESREISVVALARLFERSEFRSHTEQDER